MKASDRASSHRGRRRAGAGAVVLGLAWALAVPAASAATQPPPAAGRASADSVTDSGLSGVACPGARSCVAVGLRFTGATTAVTLAESWDGARWRVQPTPNPSGAISSALEAVSCSGLGACTAVGFDGSAGGALRPMAERWNGKTWEVQPMPTPAGATGVYLAAVACPARTACVAVGGYRRAGEARELAERWNGRSWAVQAIPTPAGGGLKELWGVSCTSPRACTAVGTWGGANAPAATLAERWNGTRWTIQPTPTPAGQNGYLDAVSCTGAAACTATGYSINDVTLVFLPLAERWNGKRWVIKATPTPAGFVSSSALAAVSCATANRCTTAGSWNNAAGEEFTLAERWNGTQWRTQPTASPAGHPVASALEGIACTAADACTAVGVFTATNGAASRPLAERWNGTRWSIQPTPR